MAEGAGRGGDMSDDEDLPPPPPIHSREPGYQETAEEREERRKRDEIREERCAGMQANGQGMMGCEEGGKVCAF
eukprot:1158352-Pelagomonas_calceolata.AAC.1